MERQSSYIRSIRITSTAPQVARALSSNPIAVVLRALRRFWLFLTTFFLGLRLGTNERLRRFLVFAARTDIVI